MHITGSNNFTFDATIGPESTTGQGNVGTTDGQQPIEIVIEGSSLLTFNDLRVQSSNGALSRSIERCEVWRDFHLHPSHTPRHSWVDGLRSRGAIFGLCLVRTIACPFVFRSLGACTDLS